MGDLVSCDPREYKPFASNGQYANIQWSDFVEFWKQNKNGYKSWNSPPSNTVWNSISMVHADNYRLSIMPPSTS